MARFGGARRPNSQAPPIAEELAPLAFAAGSPSTLQELLQEATVTRVEVAHHTVRNWGGRHENEDRTVNASDELQPGSLSYQLVGVLDGHDSDAASDMVAHCLPREVGRRLKDSSPVVEAYTSAMADLEDQLKAITATAGTCVLNCLIAGRFVWCANLGDCRAILVPLHVPEQPEGGAANLSLLPKPQVNGGVVWLSRDHKASAPYEIDRITHAGGKVIEGRVEGLEPSRTLGDFDVKENVNSGVISIEPEVRRHELSDGTQLMQAVIVCCTDGVWDVLSGQDICNLIVARKEIAQLQWAMASASASGTEVSKADKEVLHLLAEDFVQFSIAKGSRDDCTAIVAFVNVPPCGDGVGIRS